MANVPFQVANLKRAIDVLKEREVHLLEGSRGLWSHVTEATRNEHAHWRQVLALGEELDAAKERRQNLTEQFDAACATIERNRDQVNSDKENLTRVMSAEVERRQHELDASRAELVRLTVEAASITALHEGLATREAALVSREQTITSREESVEARTRELNDVKASLEAKGQAMAVHERDLNARSSYF